MSVSRLLAKVEEIRRRNQSGDLRMGLRRHLPLLGCPSLRQGGYPEKRIDLGRSSFLACPWRRELGSALSREPARRQAPTIDEKEDPMSRIETVYVVGEPQPTVEELVRQLEQLLDKNLKDLMTVFQEAGDQVWSAEPASHTVTPVPATERRPVGILALRTSWSHTTSHLPLSWSLSRIDSSD